MLKHAPLAFAGAALLALPLQALPNSDRYDWHQRDYRGERHDDRQGHSPENRLPATDKMGYGNVDMALGMAKASLAEHGIHNPSPEQIKAALNGGTVTTKSGQRVTLPGVLKLRASGMGWGQVAHKVGVKVGDVKGHGHARKKDDDKHHQKHARHHDRDDDDRHDHRKHAHHQKPDWKQQRHEYKHEHVKHHRPRPEFHRAKLERPERVHRPQKVERPHRPERPERPERHHHRH